MGYHGSLNALVLILFAPQPRIFIGLLFEQMKLFLGFQEDLVIVAVAVPFDGVFVFVCQMFPVLDE